MVNRRNDAIAIDEAIEHLSHYNCAGCSGGAVINGVTMRIITIHQDTCQVFHGLVKRHPALYQNAA
jgi:hypothetical protein